MFAHAAARASAAGDIYSDHYFDKMTQELQKFGWNIIDASNIDYIPPKQLFSISDIVVSTGGEKGLDIFEKILIGMKKANTSNLKSFCGFWWNHVYLGRNEYALAAALLPKNRNNMLSNPKVKCIYYSFNIIQDEQLFTDEWVSLFTKYEYKKLIFKIKYYEMELTMDIYNQYKDKLEEKLASKKKEHIDMVKMDL
jgi:hypothetical protein